MALFYRFYSYLIVEEAEQQATAILESANALRTYIETIQKPVIYKLKKEGRLDSDFFDPKLMSASYIARNVLNNYINADNVSYRYKLAATNPRNPINKADSFEAGILNQFRAGKLNETLQSLKKMEKSSFSRLFP